MNRWGIFFFSLIFFPPSISPWPAMASQVCAISQCQHLSVRLIQLRLRQLQRERVTGVSLILQIGFVPFVFSVRATALPAVRSEKDKLFVPRPAPFEKPLWHSDLNS